MFLIDEKMARMIITHPRTKNEVIKKLQRSIGAKIRISEKKNKGIIKKTCSFFKKNNKRKVDLDTFLEKMASISLSLQTKKEEEEISIEDFFFNLMPNFRE